MGWGIGGIHATLSTMKGQSAIGLIIILHTHREDLAKLTLKTIHLETEPIGVYPRPSAVVILRFVPHVPTAVSTRFAATGNLIGANMLAG